MSKKKKSLSVNAETMNALTAIADIKKCSENDIAETLLQNYVMENMSLLVGEINKLKSPKEKGKDNAGSENKERADIIN